MVFCFEIVLTYCEKKLFYRDQGEKNFCKTFEITRTIFKSEYIFNLLMKVPIRSLENNCDLSSEKSI